MNSELTIGEKLLLYRHRNGLTKKEVADICGISISTLSAYEKGSREPSVDVLLKLAMVFGVSVNMLIMGFDEEE